MTNFVPTTNLGANKAIVIDTTDSALSSILATPSENSATISWSSDEVTSSLVEYGLLSTYGSTTVESDTSPRVTDHSVDLSSLQACARYYYRVKSSDTAGNQTISTQKSFSTTGCTVSTISTGSEDSVETTGGTVSLTHNSSVATITAPNGYYSETSTFQINLLSTSSVPQAPTGTELIDSNFFDLLSVANSGSQVTTFLSPVTFSVNYGGNVENTYEESSLDVYKYSGGVWTNKNCTINTSANTLTCSLDGFSIYGVFGQLKTSSSVSSSNTDTSTSSSSSQCTAQRPHDIPDLFQIDSGRDFVTLYFAPASSSVTGYVVEYGQDSGAGQHAVYFEHKDTSGVVVYTIHSLSSQQDWYFKVQAKNDCIGGDWSPIKKSFVGEVIPIASSVDELTTTVPENEEEVESLSMTEPKTYTVSIFVKENNTPVKNISLRLNDLDQILTTDHEGKVVFDQVHEGEKTVHIIDQAYAAEESIMVGGDTEHFDAVIYVDAQQPLLPTEVWLGLVALGIVVTWIWFQWRKK